MDRGVPNAHLATHSAEPSHPKAMKGVTKIMTPPVATLPENLSQVPMKQSLCLQHTGVGATDGLGPPGRQLFLHRQDSTHEILGKPDIYHELLRRR